MALHDTLWNMAYIICKGLKLNARHFNMKKKVLKPLAEMFSCSIFVFSNNLYWNVNILYP